MPALITGTEDTLFIVGHLELGGAGRDAFWHFQQAVATRREDMDSRADFMQRLAALCVDLAMAKENPVNMEVSPQLVEDYMLDDLSGYQHRTVLAEQLLTTARVLLPQLPARLLRVRYLFSQQDSTYYSVTRYEG